MKRDTLALGLFSGGLDSILAARLVMEQGIAVRCVHFVSPFFGTPDAIAEWEKEYGVHVTPVDISDDFTAMLRQGPEYGFGKVMNPCVDCKILMMRTARALMDAWGASFLVSGEVLGQRPMSQRRDTLNVIRRDAQVRDVLLRPLSALHLEPTPMEESGLVDRSKLLGLFGRGRKDQLQLAAQHGFTKIPTPAGGCRLAERENARRFWPVLTRLPEPAAEDFHLSNIGRQAWAAMPEQDCVADGVPLGPETHIQTGMQAQDVAPLHAGMPEHTVMQAQAVMPDGRCPAGPSDAPLWLSIGRNQADNEALLTHVRPDDAIFKVADMPGPIALGRSAARWPLAAVADAAAYMASFAPRALAEAAAGTSVTVRVSVGDATTLHVVTAARETPCAWGEDDWIVVREQIRATAREHAD